MAKRFGRNARKELKKAIIDTSGKLDKVSNQLQEVETKKNGITREYERYRSQIFETQRNERNSVVIKLSRDYNPSVREVSIRAVSSIPSDYRSATTPLHTSFSFNIDDIQYQMQGSRDEIIAEIAMTVGRHLYEELVSHGRTNWNFK